MIKRVIVIKCLTCWSDNKIVPVYGVLTEVTRLNAFKYYNWKRVLIFLGELQKLANLTIWHLWRLGWCSWTQLHWHCCETNRDEWYAKIRVYCKRLVEVLIWLCKSVNTSSEIVVGTVLPKTSWLARIYSEKLWTEVNALIQPSYTIIY